MRKSALKLSVALSVGLGLCAGAPLNAITPAPFYAYSTGLSEVTRAVAAIEARRYGDAATILQDIAPQTPYANTKFLAGLANAGVGRLQLAKRYFSDAVYLDPNFVDAQIALAITNIRLGDRQGAEAMLRHAERRQQLCEARCEHTVTIDRTAIAIRKILSRS